MPHVHRDVATDEPPSASSRETPAVHFVTLGCPKNEVDTDRMRACVLSSAYRLAASPEEADVVVINTCGFIRAAVEESIDEVMYWAAEWRDLRPGRRIIVAGCMVSRYGSELAEALTEADALVPVADEPTLLTVIERLVGAPANARSGPGRTGAGPSAYLQVSDGCSRRCAYCTIPAIRGPHVSRPMEALLAEARFLAAAGARELVLIGQDISEYGRDIQGQRTLPRLLTALDAIEGVNWVRLMYVQPDGVTDELLESMATLPSVCHYLDIPLQHASREVLRAMRRTGDAEAFLELYGRIRAAMPDVVLRTSVIAGFPGEQRRHAAELLRFIQEAQPDYVGVFTFSPEEGTPAAEMPDQVPVRTRRARAQRLRDLADSIGWERAAERIGLTLEVLSEGLDEDGAPVGRWRGQAPEVDGVVLLDRNVEAGTIVRVRIDDTACYDLEGTVMG